MIISIYSGFFVLAERIGSSITDTGNALEPDEIASRAELPVCEVCVKNSYNLR